MLLDELLESSEEETIAKIQKVFDRLKKIAADKAFSLEHESKT